MRSFILAAFCLYVPATFSNPACAVLIEKLSPHERFLHADLQRILRQSHDSSVDIHFTTTDQTADFPEPSAERNEWWKKWIARYFGEGCSFFPSIGYLEFHYGKALVALKEAHLEILPPKSDSILYGGFRIRGTFENLLSAIANEPKIDAVIPADYQPSVRSWIRQGLQAND